MQADALGERIVRVETLVIERGQVVDRRLDRIEGKLDLLVKTNGHSPLVVNGGWTMAGLSFATALGAIGKVAGWW